MTILLNQITSFSAFIISISFVGYLFFKYFLRKDVSKTFFMLMFLGTSIFYFFSFLRTFFEGSSFLDNIFWIISMMGFNFFIVILIMTIIEIRMKVKPYFIPIFYFIIFLASLVFTGNYSVQTEDGILWIPSFFTKALLIAGLIILSILAVMFFLFGIKKKEGVKSKKGIFFSIGLIMSSSIILEALPLADYFAYLRMTSVVALSLMFYSVLLNE